MLQISLTIVEPGKELFALTGEIGNISNLRATSSYEHWLEGRNAGTITDYPRWSEPVRALLARCIASVAPSEDEDVAMPLDWSVIRIDIGINGGGRARRPTRIAMVRAERRSGAVAVGWTEGTLRGHKELILRNGYADVWEFVQHMLCKSVFLKDDLPPTRPLYVPYYCDDTGYPYMDPADLPEPVRSAFERRQSHSGRPCIRGCWMAMYIHDYADFVNGQRG